VGNLIEWHETIDTTMRRAAELADDGAPSGTIVAAAEQTAGLGRLGRAWHSPRGKGLYFTCILRPELPPEELPVITLALGVAVADALQMFCGLTCDLKWPNDVLVRGRKLAGILTQLHHDAVLAGIGLNVNQAGFPEELADTATSLILETGSEHDPRFLLRALEGSIEAHVRILQTSGRSAILRAFAAGSTWVTGRAVTVDHPGGPVLGTTAGLTPSGFLLIRRDDGAEMTVTAGGVRARERH
jgi:BirA family biotin operon repressor/biotin-[acetyl-CoA-carboxylase] ligase